MNWISKKEPNPNTVENLSKELNINKNISKILIQRNIDSFEKAKKFFRPNIKNIHNPFLMKDMNLAVERIEKAISNNKKILIYGDYDVDGTTSVSVLYLFLQSIYELHDNLEFYIPDRYKEGYGVSFIAIDYAVANDFDLVITLDCGIKAVEKVAYANEKRLDFIITDHHTPGDILPKAVAVLNPKRRDCKYPYKDLSGCGVGFKLVQALAEKRNISFSEIEHFLDLVAVSIAADIVPITGENRVFCYFGIQILNNSPRLVFKNLIELADRKHIDISDIVFGLAPRINAVGRIQHAKHSVKMLIESNLEKSKKLCQNAETQNLDRKKIEKNILKEALEQIKKQDQNKKTTVVYDPNWHKGVIGIVASKLIDTHYRPTIIFTKSGDKLAASARSVKDYHVYNALVKCSDFIEQFGGHKYAAGLTILPENLDNFAKKFEEVVSNEITKELLTPQISIDTELKLSEITPKFYRILKQLSPFGPQNMTPIFVSKNLYLKNIAKALGQEKSHLKLDNICQNNSESNLSAIGFNLGKFANEINNNNAKFDLVYSLSENTWNGKTSIQLSVRDIKILL